MASRKRPALIAVCVFYGLLCVVAGVYLNHTREAEGEAANWEGLEGRDMLPHFREGLPREAKNIWYSCHFYRGHGEATFDISEQRFLAWAF